VSVQVKWKSGMKNWHFFTNISPCFDTVQDTAIVTVQDRDIFTMEDFKVTMFLRSQVENGTR